jgi:hypothetical protein
VRIISDLERLCIAEKIHSIKDLRSTFRAENH